MLDLQGLQLRAALFRCIRRFFERRGFLEVDTPIRQPVVIPESNIEPLPSASWFLQTSPEQCMKRLLAAGCGDIFQICSCFRAEERGSRHLEEFTMLEWYRTDGDYNCLMEDCRQLVQWVLASLDDDPGFRQVVAASWFADAALAGDWQKLTVADAFAQWSDIPVQEALAADRFDEIISVEIEPKLGATVPAFLCDYPAECASLARLKAGDRNLAERFELYMNGVELANGFSELTDSSEQRRRFIEEASLIEKKTGVRRELPEKFLAELDKLNRAAGIAFGLDRFLMLLLSADHIDAVLPFSVDDLVND